MNLQMNETWLRHKNPWEKSDKSAVYFSGILRGIVGIIVLMSCRTDTINPHKTRFYY
ncbi:hypothetical protein RHAA1_04091 [Aggregatibacter actinomycetemcomitans RhAA1]|nr:hypothetical protein RHAA1_04091 [Aggregatibacter actinomycetemcomitans RhAA1]